MKPDGIADVSFGSFERLAGSDATRKVGDVGRIVSASPLNHHRVSHHVFSFSPACFQPLFNVPRAISSRTFPETVTRPGFVSCLNWRWLPRIATKYHSSSFNLLIASRTFMSGGAAR
jgi:hypothetical protein